MNLREREKIGRHKNTVTSLPESMGSIRVGGDPRLGGNKKNKKGLGDWQEENELRICLGDWQEENKLRILKQTEKKNQEPQNECAICCNIINCNIINIESDKFACHSHLICMTCSDKIEEQYDESEKCLYSYTLENINNPNDTIVKIGITKLNYDDNPQFPKKSIKNRLKHAESNELYNGFKMKDILFCVTHPNADKIESILHRDLRNLGYQKRDLINKRTGGSLTEYYVTPDLVNAEVNHILEYRGVELTDLFRWYRCEKCSEFIFYDDDYFVCEDCETFVHSKCNQSDDNNSNEYFRPPICDHCEQSVSPYYYYYHEVNSESGIDGTDLCPDCYRSVDNRDSYKKIYPNPKGFLDAAFCKCNNCYTKLLALLSAFNQWREVVAQGAEEQNSGE